MRRSLYEILDAMREVQYRNQADIFATHVEADELLVEALTLVACSLGDGAQCDAAHEIAGIYRRMEKWYE